MIEEFEKYLEKKGYSIFTPSGKPSTTYNYAKVRIPRICEREGITVQKLADNINFYVEKYDKLGSESEFGSKSKNAYICALKRFEEFVKVFKY
ncbi:hypothetical protein EZS27_020372 [termite gut metagenome]|uniref:Tyrosine recombinase XerC n=1 Tax=termite gut metagenome TaxID=433724 RepID=A0A5J4RBA9_9ZZZZ